MPTPLPPTMTEAQLAAYLANQKGGMPGSGSLPTGGAMPTMPTTGSTIPTSDGGASGEDGGSILGTVGSLASGIDWGSLLGKIGSFAKDNAGSLAMGGLAAAQALAAAKASARASGFQDKAINLAEGNWNQGADLRTQGKAGMLTPAVSDHSALFAGSQNPFATPGPKKITPPPGGTHPTPIPTGGLPMAPAPALGGLAGAIKKLPPSLPITPWQAHTPAPTTGTAATGAQAGLLSPTMRRLLLTTPAVRST